MVQVKGPDEAVLVGEKLPLIQRLWTIAAEKFVGKFLPAAVAFILAAMYLPGTTAVMSAAIGAVAASVGVLFEVAIVASNTGAWKWRDLS